MLDDGTVLDADICVVGAGIVPATGFIKPGSIKFERDGSVVTDEVLIQNTFTDLKASPSNYIMSCNSTVSQSS